MGSQLLGIVMTKNIIFLIVILVFLLISTGCLQNQKPLEQNSTYNATSAIIDIALKNESVQQYLHGNWSITGSSSCTFTYPDMSFSGIQIETDTYYLKVCVDVPNNTVFIGALPKRNPPPGFVIPQGT
jgi:hypothetical protein